jgi:hypothetical protein
MAADQVGHLAHAARAGGHVAQVAMATVFMASLRFVGG